MFHLLKKKLRVPPGFKPSLLGQNVVTLPLAPPLPPIESSAQKIVIQVHDFTTFPVTLTLVCRLLRPYGTKTLSRHGGWLSLHRPRRVQADGGHPGGRQEGRCRHLLLPPGPRKLPQHVRELARASLAQLLRE